MDEFLRDSGLIHDGMKNPATNKNSATDAGCIIPFALLLLSSVVLCIQMWL